MTTYDANLASAPYRKLRLWVLDRDNHTCQIRGPKCKGWATEVDHIVCRADGGATYDPANMRAACHPCNMGRSARRSTDVRGRRRPWAVYRAAVVQPDTRW